MKTTRKIISTVLALILVLGTLSVTAFAQSSTVDWEYFGDGDTVYYGGEVDVGSNVFSGHIGNYAYKFTAPEEGVYCLNDIVNDYPLSLNGGFTILYLSETCTEGEAFGDAEEFYADGKDGSCYYFEKGETQYIGIYSSGRFKNYDINIEYLGKVTDFGFTENRPLQADWDVWVETEENITTCYFDAPVFIETDKGIIISSRFYYSFEVAEGTELKTGTNKLEAECLGFKKELEFEVFYLYDIIESAKTLEGFTSPTVYILDDIFDGGTNLDIAIFETGSTDKIELTLKDGSTVLCNKNTGLYSYSLTATLADGRTIHIPVEPVSENGKYYFAIALENGEKMIVGEAQLYDFETDPGDDEPVYGPIMTIIMRIIDFFRNLIRKIFFLVMPI